MGQGEAQPGRRGGWKRKGAKLKGSARDEMGKEIAVQQFQPRTEGAARAPRAARVHFEQQKDQALTGTGDPGGCGGREVGREIGRGHV